ncbi:MAG TPA: SAM-dependent methyltransferase, partial [Lachnospiraceae bacterium]|nr:SAM-dependent methyltransferase [Lachnospiraceae bacterium]
RFQETHLQRAYSIEKIKELLEKAGMKFVAAYDAFTKESPKEDSERVYIIAKEQWQENKLYV